MNAVSQDHYPEQMSIKPVGYTFMIRVAVALAGLIALAVLSVRLASVGGDANLPASFVLIPIAAGLSLIVMTATFSTRWQRAAFWFSIAILGQAAALQLVNAGYQLRYQHYKPLGELLQYPNVLYLAAIGVQLILVAGAMRELLPAIVRWVRENLRLWQVIVLTLCFFLPTTTVSADLSIYFSELVLASALQLLNLATIVIFANAIPAGSLPRLRESMRRLIASTPDGGNSYRLAVVAAIFVAVLAVVLSIYSYERHPHVPDEVAYLTQAQFFASGSITMPAPPVPEAFEVYLMKIDGGRWYPVTPPGWAILLSIGAWFGVPFVVNPVLAGINVLLVFWLVGRMYSPSLAGSTVLLLAISPWFVFLAMSFMTHMAALTCLLIAAVGVVKARETENWKWAILSGIGIGMISTIRPLEAVAVAGLMGLWMLGVGGKRVSIASMAAAGFAALLFGGMGLAFNLKLTGNPLQFPINVYTDEVFGAGSNAYGFGPDRGMGWQLDPYPGHGPFDALVNTNLNVSALNSELLGWSIGSFLLIGAFLCFARFRRGDYLMFAVIAVIYILHFFYYFSGGPDFGARYWFLMIIPLLVLTVRGIESLAGKLNELENYADVRVFAAVAALSVLTLAVFVPWRAVDKYRDFRGMTPDIRELATEMNFGRSLVLVQGNKHPDYDSAFIYNSTGLSGDGPIYAWDRDETTREKLLSVYGDRPVWIVRSPSLTGKSYEVAAGPLNAREVAGTVKK